MYLFTGYSAIKGMVVKWVDTLMSDLDVTQPHVWDVSA